jgi:hypothetical protein
MDVGESQNPIVPDLAPVRRVENHGPAEAAQGEPGRDRDNCHHAIVGELEEKLIQENYKRKSKWDSRDLKSSRKRNVVAV